MLVICGLLWGAGDECFPKWFRDIFGKHMDDIGKAQIIARSVEASRVIDNDEVPMYPGLTITIMKIDWIDIDLGKRAALVNAAKGLSPFSMVNLTEEDVAEMAQKFEDLDSANTISAADVKATRSKMAATTQRDLDSFMLILKRYTNLLHALFSSVCPLYLQMYEIVQAFRDYSPN